MSRSRDHAMAMHALAEMTATGAVIDHTELEPDAFGRARYLVTTNDGRTRCWNERAVNAAYAGHQAARALAS